MRKIFLRFIVFFAVLMLSACGVYSIDRRSVVSNLHRSLEKSDFAAAAYFNSILANEAFSRAYRCLKVWEKVRDSATGLLPRGAGRGQSFWNAKDTAADLFPFLFLASSYLDRDNEWLWVTVLQKERDICGKMPCTVLLRSTVIEREETPDVIFGASEYAKDGLLAITERLGKGPWFNRMEEIEEEIIKASDIPSSSGMIPSSNAEVNGNLLQVLTRLYWATAKVEYLKMAERIGDRYFFEVLPQNNYLPPYDWSLSGKKELGSHFRLRDHGNEIVPGLTELYLLEKLRGMPKAAQYRKPLKEFLDLILKVARTTDGLWYEDVDIHSRIPGSNIVTDNWGYILNAYQMFDLAEGVPFYQNEIRKVMLSVAARKAIPCGDATYDSYADSIESMLYMLPWFDIPECHLWVDNEIEAMFRMQKSSGFIDKYYLDGNFIRTALLYGTYKTMGIVTFPWRKDLFLGAVYDKKKNELYIHLRAKKPWKGFLKFDLPRHRTIWNLPFEYPRLNQTPEWFVVEPNKRYTVSGLKQNKAIVLSGESLAQGLAVNLEKGNLQFELKVSEEATK